MEKFEKIINNIKEISLTPEDKARILGSVVSYVRETPVREPGVVKRRWHILPAVVMLLVVMLGGGISMAANDALPGDFLYPVKVSVNEKMETWIALSAEADAKVEAKHAEERLEEAEELAVRGEIKAEVKEEVKANFKKKAARARALAEELKAEGKLETSARLNSEFESVLVAHERILSDISESDDDDQEEINEIRGEVGGYLSAAAEARARNESEIAGGVSVNVTAAAREALQAALEKIEEVEGYIESHPKGNTRPEAIARLDDSREILLQGRGRLESGAYGEAFILFQRAYRMAQETKLWLNIQNSLQVERKENMEKENDGEDKEIRVEVEVE